MKKLFGKIILAILTICMAFAVVGCGGSGDNGDNGGNTGGGNNGGATHTEHTFVDGKCSCGQYELFLAVSNDNMANFTLVIEIDLDTKRTEPGNSAAVLGPEWGTRKTKEVHTIKVADGKFYEEYVIRDYDTEEVLEQATKTFTGSEAKNLINSVVTQVRGYAFYKKLYDGKNVFVKDDDGYTLIEGGGFSYSRYSYLSEGGVEYLHSTMVSVNANDLTIKVQDGKITSMQFKSTEKAPDAQKSWFFETLSATYTFSNYGATTIA